MDTVQHSHCDSCFSLSCSVWDAGCPLSMCPACGIQMHDCKLEDHENVCPERRIPCINSAYDCPYVVKRGEMPRHLAECPILMERVIPDGIIWCEHCNQPLRETELSNHEVCCTEITVPCTNSSSGCQSVMKRREINSHLQHCPASIIQCKFTHYRKPITKQGALDHTSPDVVFLSSDETFVRESLQRGEITGGQMSHETLDDFRTKSNHKRLPVNESDYTTDLSLDIFRGTAYYEHTVSGCLFDQRYLTGNQAVNLVSRNLGNKDHSYQQSKGFCFECSQFVRRDEFSYHWQNHVDIIDELAFKVRRCPLQAYGCPETVTLFQPKPKGSTFAYSPDLLSFVVRPRQLIVQENVLPSTNKQELALYGYGEGSADKFQELPYDILLTIVLLLDSLSLWNLSLVNHFFRNVCQEFVHLRGIVHQYWVRGEAYKQDVHWELEKRLASYPWQSFSTKHVFFFFRTGHTQDLLPALPAGIFLMIPP